MIDEKCLDTIRIILLLVSLTINAVITYYTTSRLDVSWASHILVGLEFLSLIYIFLTYLRRGYVDYESEEFKKGVLSKASRYCRHCNGFKPPRSHHCSTCNKCIKKMDDHCMWLGVCVNFDNHADFIRFLFFTFLSMVASFLLIILYIYEIPYSTYTLKIGISLLWNMLYSATVAVITGAMLKIQFGLISKNLTYIEDQYFYAVCQKNLYD